MVILGIDPALTITGYGVINIGKDSHISLVEAGIIKTCRQNNIPLRLKKIHKAVNDLLTEFRPDAAVLEKIYAHYRHPTTAFVLGQARGVICLACAQSEIPLTEYSATRVKKAIVGRGLASKQQVQSMVAKLLNFQEIPRYTDVTDALALAIAHSRIFKVKL